jgi:hypothetical protein
VANAGPLYRYQVLHAAYMLKTHFSIVTLLASTGADTVVDASFEIEVIIASK